MDWTSAGGLDICPSNVKYVDCHRSWHWLQKKTELQQYWFKLQLVGWWIRHNRNGIEPYKVTGWWQTGFINLWGVEVRRETIDQCTGCHQPTQPRQRKCIDQSIQGFVELKYAVVGGPVGEYGENPSTMWATIHIRCASHTRATHIGKQQQLQIEELRQRSS